MTRAENSYKAFRQIIDDDDWPYVNMIHAPDTTMYVLDAVAKFFNTVFAAEKVISWETQRGEQSEDLVPALDDVTKWMIRSSDGEFHSESYDALWTKGLFGNGYLGVFPFFDNYSKNRRAVVGSEFINADYWDIFPDPGQPRYNRRGSYLWHRQYVDPSLTEKAFNDGTFTGNFNEVPRGKPWAETTEHKELMEAAGILDWQPEFDDLDEWMHRYEDGEVITVINRGYIARDTAKTAPGFLPYDLPFAGTRYIQLANEFFGIGIGEVVDAMQTYKNLILSQHADNLDLILNAVIKGRRDADIDWSQIKSHPHALWLWDESPDDIEVVTFPDVTSQSMVANAQFAEGQMERGTSMWRYTLGQEPAQGREAATTVMQLRQAGLNRIDAQIKLDEQVFWRQIAWKMARIAETKMHDDLFERVTGKKKDAVFGGTDEVDMKYRVDAVPMGSSVTGVQELRAEQMAQMFQIFTTMDPRLPQADPVPFRLSLLPVLDAWFESQGIPRRLIDKAMIKLEQGGLPGSGTGPEGGAFPIPQNTLTGEGTGQLAAALRGVNP